MENPSYNVVHDTAESEVYAITMDNVGNLYFGTSTRQPSYLLLPSIFMGLKDLMREIMSSETLYTKQILTAQFRDYFSLIRH